MKRWKWAVIVAMACTSILCALPLAAQDYPTKPVEMVVPFGPGGGTDLTARAIADVCTKYLGQPLVVINKPGASGIIGSQYALNSKPDGYTMLMVGGSHTVSVPHFRSMTFNPITDFDPVIRFTVQRIGFYVKSDSKWKTMKDFLQDVKENPEKYTYGSSGVGTIHHAAVLVTEQRTGIRMTHVPSKSGGAESLAALAGGHLDMAIASPNEADALVQGGRIRCLAITAQERSPAAPGVPTMRELGHDVYLDIQMGLAFPKGVAQPIRQKVHDAGKKVYDDPQFKDRAEKLKLELSYLNGDDFRKALKTMYDQVGESVKK